MLLPLFLWFLTFLTTGEATDQPASNGRPRGKIQTPPRTELTHACNRQHSRVVRNMLSKPMNKQRLQADKGDPWPDGCFLNPKVDLWANHEKAKTRQAKGRGAAPNQGSLWQCGYDNKTFKSEHYIDLYLERYYMNETPADGLCLAEYCEPFNLCQNWDSGSMWDFLTSEPPACDDDYLRPLREKCVNVLEQCFPNSENNSRSLKSTWCDHLSCEYRSDSHKTHHKVMIVVACGILGLIVLYTYICCFNVDERKKRQKRSYTERRKVYRKKRQ